MFKSTKDFDTAMYEVLIKIRDNEDFKTLSPKYELYDLTEALGRCSDCGYVTGVFPQRMASGNLSIDLSTNVRITPSGLQFIENFNS